MTQLDRILAILRDRREHTAAELYATGCVLHSRISDLRKRGYVIELSRADGVGATSFLYRLISVPDEALQDVIVPLSESESVGDTARTSSASSGTGANEADGCLPSVPAVPVHVGQMTVWEAPASRRARAVA